MKNPKGNVNNTQSNEGSCKRKREISNECEQQMNESYIPLVL
jgi:hypothetical protein